MSHKTCRLYGIIVYINCSLLYLSLSSFFIYPSTKTSKQSSSSATQPSFSRKIKKSILHSINDVDSTILRDQERPAPQQRRATCSFASKCTPAFGHQNRPTSLPGRAAWCFLPFTFFSLSSTDTYVLQPTSTSSNNSNCTSTTTSSTSSTSSKSCPIQLKPASIPPSSSRPSPHNPPIRMPRHAPGKLCGPLLP